MRVLPYHQEAPILRCKTTLSFLFTLARIGDMFPTKGLRAMDAVSVTDVVSMVYCILKKNGCGGENYRHAKRK